MGLKIKGYRIDYEEDTSLSDAFFLNFNSRMIRRQWWMLFFIYVFGITFMKWVFALINLQESNGGKLWSQNLEDIIILASEKTYLAWKIKILF